MGVKSTHLVTRDVAMQAILSKLYSMDDDRLANVLEEVVDSDFHNFHIVSREEITENLDSEYPSPCIQSVSDLPGY